MDFGLMLSRFFILYFPHKQFSEDVQNLGDEENLSKEIKRETLQTKRKKRILFFVADLRDFRT